MCICQCGSHSLQQPCIFVYCNPATVVLVKLHMQGGVKWMHIQHIALSSMVVNPRAARKYYLLSASAPHRVCSGKP